MLIQRKVVSPSTNIYKAGYKCDGCKKVFPRTGKWLHCEELECHGKFDLCVNCYINNIHIHDMVLYVIDDQHNINDEVLEALLRKYQIISPSALFAHMAMLFPMIYDNDRDDFIKMIGKNALDPLVFFNNARNTAERLKIKLHVCSNFKVEYTNYFKEIANKLGITYDTEDNNGNDYLNFRTDMVIRWKLAASFLGRKTQTFYVSKFINQSCIFLYGDFHRFYKTNSGSRIVMIPYIDDQFCFIAYEGVHTIKETKNAIREFQECEIHYMGSIYLPDIHEHCKINIKEELDLTLKSNITSAVLNRITFNYEDIYSVSFHIDYTPKGNLNEFLKKEKESEKVVFDHPFTYGVYDIKKEEIVLMGYFLKL